MLVEASIPGSDDWWLNRVLTRLGEGLPRMFKLQSYIDGDALVPVELTGGERESYLRFMKRSRLHTVETLRDARTNRQEVIGFRTAAAGDEDGDAEAWRMWLRSRMDIQSEPFFNDTADFGASYVVTIPLGDGTSTWQIRNGWDTAAVMSTLQPWLTEAAVTYDYDPIRQREVAVLYRRGFYRVASREAKVPTLPKNGSTWVPLANWEWDGEREYTPETTENLVTVNHTPDWLGIYEKHLDTVDRINEITLNALSIIVQQAFRQRAIEGKVPEFYPEGHERAGQKINYDELFKSGPAAIWLLGEATIKELANVDVTPVYNARKSEVEYLASLTATPLYVFQGDAANQSATGAELAREQLVFAVRKMNRRASACITQFQAIAFALAGDTVRADVTQIEVIFAKINPATLAERAESAAKFKAGGATQRWIDQNVLEMTPAERRQAEQDRMTEAFTAALAGGGTSGDNARPNQGTS